MTQILKWVSGFGLVVGDSLRWHSNTLKPYFKEETKNKG
jgi:hypothetical protein